MTFLRNPGSTGFFCTASLIGRRTGLAAAHCAEDGATVEFCFSPCGKVNGCATAPTCVRALVVRDPSYNADMGNLNTFDHDVEVLKLDLLPNGKDFTTLTNPPIVPYLIGGPVQEQETFIMVGYGCTHLQDQTGAGQQRFGENSIDSVQDQTVQFYDPSRAYSCFGDSGGPASVANCEVGVIVGNQTPPLGGPTADVLSRVDTKAAWIQQTAGDSSVHQCFQTVCGDGLCQFPEAACSCPQDCGTCPTPRCGDGVCNGRENHQTCPQDCVDGQCSGGKSDCCDDGVCRTGALCKRLGCI